VRGIDAWSSVTGLVAGGLITMAVSLRDQPPEFIAKWGRGADGERRTEQALTPLVRGGWKVRHDVPLRFGNADHVLRSPTGLAFLLETKALAGHITLERGELICRFADDPEEVRRHDVKRQIASLTKQVQDKWAARTGQVPPTLRPVVVIWGNFPARVVQDGDVAYVAGDALVEYLRAA
jgi:hypothetical protein